jgi:regulator of cell morphogenesis and NO signaling
MGKNERWRKAVRPAVLPVIMFLGQRNSIGAMTMKTFNGKQTVGDIVTRNPHLSRVFEDMGIDYCCGGKNPLATACRERGLDQQQVLDKLQEADRATYPNVPQVDVTTLSLTELVDHIEYTHHAYLQEELPRLAALAGKVAARHGERDPRLRKVQETFRAMAEELGLHMFKEEQRLFPMIRQLEASDRSPAFHCGTLGNPIRQMEFEHDDAGAALKRLRELTDGFEPPDWACNSYRALLAGLAYLERDMHSHIHKENNVLFPGTLDLEASRQRGLPVA